MPRRVHYGLQLTAVDLDYRAVHEVSLGRGKIAHQIGHFLESSNENDEEHEGPTVTTKGRRKRIA